MQAVGAANTDFKPLPECCAKGLGDGVAHGAWDTSTVTTITYNADTATNSSSIGGATFETDGPAIAAAITAASACPNLVNVDNNYVDADRTCFISTNGQLNTNRDSYVTATSATLHSADRHTQARSLDVTSIVSIVIAVPAADTISYDTV